METQAKVENISDREYYGSYGEMMSVSLLKRFYDDPTTFEAYLANRSDFEVPKTHLIVGQAIHCLTLEGKDAFNDNFSVADHINPKTGKSFGRETKSWEKFCRENEHNIWRTINEEEFRTTLNIARACMDDPEMGDLIRTCNRVEWAVRGTLEGVKFQGKMDAWDGNKLIFDLKTTGDITTAFESGMRFKYGWQSVAYKRLLASALGHKPSDFRFVFGFVQKEEPYHTKLIESEEFETPGMVGSFDRAISAARKCRELGDYSIGGLFM